VRSFFDRLSHEWLRVSTPLGIYTEANQEWALDPFTT